jgi:hypothetical protein
MVLLESDIAELLGFALGSFALGWGVGLLFKAFRQLTEHI